MPSAARKSKPDATKSRAELCRELLEIERDNPDIFLRIKAIKAELKQAAETDGKFRESFPGLGYVSVSPGKPAETTGEAPAIDVDAWLKLKPSRRDRLLEEGWVSLQPIIKGASYGQVRVELHTPKAA